MKLRRESGFCPCGSGIDYAACCQPLHDGKMLAESADQLMRSRYSAYALKLEGYLLTTWHPDTRPPSLGLDQQQPPPGWLGLEVRHHARQDDDHATVEFIARFRVGGVPAQRLHETSRFVREDGRWYYLDGDISSDLSHKASLSQRHEKGFVGLWSPLTGDALALPLPLPLAFAFAFANPESRIPNPESRSKASRASGLLHTR